MRYWIYDRAGRFCGGTSIDRRKTVRAIEARGFRLVAVSGGAR